MIYSSSAERQPDSKNAVVKIKNETHGLIIYNIPEILERTPAESRTHDTQAISEVFERTSAMLYIIKPWVSFLIFTTAFLESGCVSALEL